MLQQTRVETVVGYFARWMARWPTWRALAAASQDDVLAQWTGLGYYNRARNVHRAAQVVVAEHAAILPSDPVALARLPGLGPYTVGAVRSIAFGHPAALVDGNVARVLARWFALADDPMAGAGKAHVWQLAADELLAGRPAARLPQDWNQALMELGATICTPKNPQCQRCPVAADCAARQRGMVAVIPPVRQRAIVQAVSAHYLVAERADGQVLLGQRPQTGRWAGLWEPPGAEGHDAQRQMRELARALQVMELRPLAGLTHVLTHRRYQVQALAGTATADELPAPGQFGYTAWRWQDRQDAQTNTAGLSRMGQKILGLLAVLLVACGQATAPTAGKDGGGSADVVADADIADAVVAEVAAPDPTKATAFANGPLHCGYRTAPIGYELPVGLGKRDIPLHIWYPTTATSGEHPTYSMLFADPTAVTDAALAPPLHKAGFPLLVHSHGYQGFAGNSAALFCFLASHGWVILVPEHVGNTLLDTPDKLPLAHWLARPLDIRQAVKWAKAPPAGDPLAGKLDPGHMAVSGHSFGTYTVWANAGATFDQAVLLKNCQDGKWSDCKPELLKAFAAELAEPQFRTAVALAGDGSDLFGPQGKNAVKMPILQMNGSLDNAGQAELYKDVTAVDLTWVNVEGGCHQLYGLGNPVYGAAACAGLPAAEGFAIVNAWVLSWLRVHALDEAGGEAAQVVAGTKIVSARCLVQRKNPK